MILDEDYLSTMKTAKALGLGHQRVQQLACSGILPCVRNAFNWRLFKKADVEEYRKKREALEKAKVAVFGRR